MATFKPSIGYRRADNTYNVRIRVIHNRKTKYIPTSMYLEESDVSRAGKIRSRDILDRIDRLYLRKFRDIVSSIEGAEFYDVDILCKEIVRRFRNNDGFRLDFFKYLDEKTRTMKPKTSEGYRCAANALRRFLQRDDLDVNEITTPLIIQFRTFLENEKRIVGGSHGHRHQLAATKKGGRSISMYLGCLRHIHNLAREEFNDEDVGRIAIPRTPFKRGVIPQQPKTAHRDLTADQLVKIFNYEGKGRAMLAHDVFLLSFCLVGINSVDLYHAKRSDLKDGVLTYGRIKTQNQRDDGAVISIRIEPEAERLIEKYRDQTKGEYLFVFHSRYSDHRNFNTALNIGLKAIAQTVGGDIPRRLQFYHARHSWATIARNECGVEFETVNESLDHSRGMVGRVTDIYVRRDFSRIWEANRKVLDYVFRSRIE